MYIYRCIWIYADIVGFTRHWGKVLLVLCLTSKALLEHPMFSDKDFFLPRQDLSFARGTYMLSWCDKCFNFPTMNLDKSVYLFFFLFVNNLFYHISHRSLNFQSYCQHNAISNYQTKSLYSAISQTLLRSNISP